MTAGVWSVAFALLVILWAVLSATYDRHRRGGHDRERCWCGGKR